jgi:hypothetical protein
LPFSFTSSLAAAAAAAAAEVGAAAAAAAAEAEAEAGERLGKLGKGLPDMLDLRAVWRKKRETRRLLTRGESRPRLCDCAHWQREVKRCCLSYCS